MKRITLYFLAVGFIFLITGCLGTSEYDLHTGTWRLVQLAPSVPNAELDFNVNGTVIYKNLDAATIDTGDYTLRASIEHRYLEIFELPIDTTQELESYNGKWTIIKLDETSLIMAIPTPGVGIIQREFEKL